MNDTLKVASRIGAELGAAKAEVDRLRGLLRELRDITSEYAWDADLEARVDAALSQQPEPTDTYTAVDMATAAAQGFRDGQAAVEPAPAQDEQQPVAVPESWWQLIHDTLRYYRMGTLGDGYGGGYPLIDAMTADGQSVSGGIEECTYLADAIWNALRAAPIAQTAPDSDMRDNYLDLLQEVLDAKEVMRAAGIEQGSFGAMFKQLAKQTAPQPEQSEPNRRTLQWVVDRWHAEVANRPLVNVHRRTLDSTWRQMIRHLGEDDVVLLGPRHDDMLDASGNPLPQYAAALNATQQENSHE